MRRPPPVILPTTPEQDRRAVFHVRRRSRPAVLPSRAANPYINRSFPPAAKSPGFLAIFLSSPFSKKVHFLHSAMFITSRERVGNLTFEHSNACSAPQNPLRRQSFRQFEQGFEHFAPKSTRSFLHVAPTPSLCTLCTTARKKINK